MSRFSAPIAEQIWDMKYRLKAQDGTAIDASVEDSWRRVARALAVVEKSQRFGKSGFTKRWKALNTCQQAGLQRVLAPGAMSPCSTAL